MPKWIEPGVAVHAARPRDRLVGVSRHLGGEKYGLGISEGLHHQLVGLGG